jgi:hypothetical protein
MDGVFESGAGRGPRRIWAKGVALGGVAGLLIVAGVQLTAVRLGAADRAFWQVAGPPCPTATWADLNRIPRPLAQVKDFGGARFARISGAILCNDTTDGIGVMTGAVCQFNRPRALAVWSKGGSALFQFPGGQPATVTVADDHPPRCVMATHYLGE